MKYKLYYTIVFIITSLLCFSGCTESSSTESKADKRALEDTDSSTAETVVTTTLTPLQTFTRFTAFAERTEEAHTEDAVSIKNKETAALTESDRTDWFEQNKLFDMELSGDNDSDTQTTWYNFWEEEEQITTSVSVSQIMETQSLPPMITRDPADFVPGE